MEIVLLQPEIPHNTGCIARLSAAIGLRLHLVEPLGYSLEDRYLKRAGLDYWPFVDLVVHASWEALRDSLEPESQRSFGQRLRLFSARGGTSLFDTRFEPDDVLLFGKESAGLPQELLDEFSDQHVYIPIRAGIRSLNLASTACLAAYTAMVAAGVPLPDNDGAYVPFEGDARSIQPADRVR